MAAKSMLLFGCVSPRGLVRSTCWLSVNYVVGSIGTLMLVIYDIAQKLLFVICSFV